MQISKLAVIARRLLLIVILPVVIASCAGPKEFLYEGTREAHEIASIVGTHYNRLTFRDTHSFDAYFLNINGKTLGNGFIGRPNEIDVLPGTHQITVHCANNAAFGYPLAVINAQAGHLYEVACHSADNNQVKAVVTDKGRKLPK